MIGDIPMRRFENQVHDREIIREILRGGMAAQAEQVMKNIGSMLESLGLAFTDVAKTTCYLTDSSLTGEFNAVYKKYFTGKPSRVCLTVKALPENVLCEVECIAYKEERQGGQL